jgi:cell division initiation protein
MLTATDITNKKFEKKLNGYKTIEVNSFLVEVSSTISQLNRENADLKRKIDIANKKLTEYETEHSTLSQALLNAHRMAETVVKDAQAKADLTVRYAEIRSDKIKEKAKESIIAEQEEFARLKKEITEFRSNILDIYKKHIELILAIPNQSSDSQKKDANTEQSDDNENLNAENKNVVIEQAAPANDVAEDHEPVVTEPAKTDEPQIPPQQDQKKESNFKLNLRFDDETGEYIPTDSEDRRTKLQSLKFGADYDTLSVKEENTDSSFFKKKK